jgi:hypothetical protein
VSYSNLGDSVFSRSHTELADLIWHEHMLDTKRYAQDCGRLFGRFLHHVPGDKYCFGETE